MCGSSVWTRPASRNPTNICETYPHSILLIELCEKIEKESKWIRRSWIELISSRDQGCEQHNQSLEALTLIVIDFQSGLNDGLSLDYPLVNDFLISRPASTDLRWLRKENPKIMSI